MAVEQLVHGTQPATAGTKPTGRLVEQAEGIKVIAAGVKDKDANRTITAINAADFP